MFQVRHLEASGYFVSIDVEVEILLADCFISAVVTDFFDCRIQLFPQIIVTLAQSYRNLGF